MRHIPQDMNPYSKFPAQFTVFYQKAKYISKLNSKWGASSPPCALHSESKRKPPDLLDHNPVNGHRAGLAQGYRTINAGVAAAAAKAFGIAPLQSQAKPSPQQQAFY